MAGSRGAIVVVIVVVGINGFLSKYITGHSIDQPDQAPSDSSIKHYILIHGLPPLSSSTSQSARDGMFDVWDIIAVLISVSPSALSKVSNKQIIG